MYRVNDIQNSHNETQTVLQEVKHALKDMVTRGIDHITDEVKEAKEETKDAVMALR